MSETITDDAVGKDVVDAQNEKIGIVTAVENGTAKVDPDPGLTDKFKAKLSWEDADAEDYPLQEEAIETITDDEIRLQYGR
ncbi:hypothetical protein BRC89_02685 [Halobacteriales archaeon QS_4_70_19]|nr:MAG: hypothetical protein BRC89_02685 [Halobacteriales archaeon QS_4_70_19]